MKIAILILAAGSSSRMGSPKQLLPIANTTLLGLAIEHAINSKAHKTYCILGANAVKIKKSINNYSIETILNLNFEKGLSSSIIEGVSHLKALNFDAALIMLADQPSTNTDYINSLIDAFNKNPEYIIASNYNGINGVPAIFPKKTFSQLLMLKGDKGAKSLLNNDSLPVKHINTNFLDDLDTPEDYENFLKILNNVNNF